MTVNTVNDVVATALRAHIAPAVLIGVLVFDEEDSDGDSILRIQAVVDSNGPALGADKVFGATGVVRAALGTLGDRRFPLLSFPSSNEMAGVAA